MGEQTTSTGWISLSRSIQNHWIWERPLYLKWWLDLIMMAEYRDRTRVIGTKSVIIKRGQLIASIRYLCVRWQYWDHGMSMPSRNAVCKFLRLLETEEMIKRECRKVNKLETLITICNYDNYQQFLYPTTDNKWDNKTDSNNDSNQASKEDSNNDSNQASKEDSKSNKFNNITINTLSHIRKREDGSEDNGAMLDALFTDASMDREFEKMLKILNAENPATKSKEDLRALADEIVAKWEITRKKHKGGYNDWSSHLFSEIEKLNKRYGQKNKRRDTGRSAEERQQGGNDAELIE